MSVRKPTLEGLRFVGGDRDGNVIGEFTSSVSRYAQEWREGPYEASWRMAVDGESNVTMKDLEHWFEQRLGTYVAVFYNGREVWRGRIGKMTLNTTWEYMGEPRAVAETKDLMKVVNAAKCSFHYTPSDGLDAIGYTNWYVDTTSLSLYGPLETMIQFDGRADEIHRYDDDNDSRTPPLLLRDPDLNNRLTSEADVLAEREVIDNSDPYAGFATGDPNGDWLEVTAYGAQVFANKILLSDGPFAYYFDYVKYDTYEYDRIDRMWTYRLRKPVTGSIFAEVSHGDAEWEDEEGNLRTYTASDEIKRIIDVLGYPTELYGQPAQPLYYTDGSIAYNGTPVTAGYDRVIGAFDRLRELAKLPAGDGSGDYYTLTIELDGRVVYQKRDDTPQYILRMGRGIESVGGGDVPLWDARPAPMELRKYGSSEHKRVRHHEAVVMREGADQPLFTEAAKNSAERTRALVTAERNRIKRLHERNERKKK